jgi:hypothetical protein
MIKLRNLERRDLLLASYIAATKADPMAALHSE